MTRVHPELTGIDVEQDKGVADLLGLDGRGYEGDGNEGQSSDNAADNTQNHG